MEATATDDVLAARHELRRRGDEFRRIDRALGPNDRTTDEWFAAAIRRHAALRRLRALAPDDGLVRVEDHRDAWSFDRAKAAFGV